MIAIILTVLLSTGIFIIFRLFQYFRIDNLQAITTNYLVAALFGFTISYGDYTISGIIDASWFPLSVILGIIFITVFYLFALSSQKVGIALTSIASKMSVVIPVTLGILLYKESSGTIKIVGILAALLAFYLSIKKSKHTRISRLLYLLPVSIFLGNGIVDSLLKYAQYYHLENDTILFLSMIFLTAFFCGILVFLFRERQDHIALKLKNIAGGIVLGLFNFGSTYYIIEALHHLESSVVFPIYNSGVICLSAITGLIAFKEKLSIINWIGIIIAIFAILFIANA